MPFTGFPPAALIFYEGLEADNSRTYWHNHRQTYELAVREPLGALLDEVEAEFGPAKLFRPHRDIRFSADKSPFKTHQGAFFGRGGSIGYYVQISADGLAVGGGFRATSPHQTSRFREAIADEGSGQALVAVVDDLKRVGMTLLGEAVKTAPRGYPRDHPRIDMLRRKELMTLRQFGEPEWLATPRAAAEIVGTWRALGPLLTWFDEHVPQA